MKRTSRVQPQPAPRPQLHALSLSGPLLRPCNRAISTVIVPRSTGPACPVLLGSPGYPQLPPGRHLTVQGHFKHSTIVLLSWSFQPHQTASSPIRYSGQNPTCRPWFFTSRPLTSKPSICKFCRLCSETVPEFAPFSPSPQLPLASLPCTIPSTSSTVSLRLFQLPTLCSSRIARIIFLKYKSDQITPALNLPMAPYHN